MRLESDLLRAFVRNCPIGNRNAVQRLMNDGGVWKDDQTAGTRGAMFLNSGTKVRPGPTARFDIQSSTRICSGSICSPHWAASVCCPACWNEKYLRRTYLWEAINFLVHIGLYCCGGTRTSVRASCGPASRSNATGYLPKGLMRRIEKI